MLLHLDVELVQYVNEFLFFNWHNFSWNTEHNNNTVLCVQYIGQDCRAHWIHWQLNWPQPRFQQQVSRQPALQFHFPVAILNQPSSSVNSGTYHDKFESGLPVMQVSAEICLPEGKIYQPETIGHEFCQALYFIVETLKIIECRTRNVQYHHATWACRKILHRQWSSSLHIWTGHTPPLGRRPSLCSSTWLWLGRSYKIKILSFKNTAVEYQRQGSPKIKISTCPLGNLFLSSSCLKLFWTSRPKFRYLS